MQTETNNRLLRIAKSSAMLFVIGIALAVAIPAIMGAVGVTGPLATFTGASVLSSGIFFAGFGALNEAIGPVFDKMFGIEQQPSQKEVIVINNPSQEPAVSQNAIGIDDVSDTHTGFAQRILDEKLIITANAPNIS